MEGARDKMMRQLRWHWRVLRAYFTRIVMLAQKRVVSVRPSRVGHDERIFQDRLDYLSKKKGSKNLELTTGVYKLHPTITVRGDNITIIGADPSRELEKILEILHIA